MAETPRAPNPILKLLRFSLYPFVSQFHFSMSFRNHMHTNKHWIVCSVSSVVCIKKVSLMRWGRKYRHVIKLLIMEQWLITPQKVRGSGISLYCFINDMQSCWYWMRWALGYLTKASYFNLPSASDEHLFIAQFNTPTCKIDKSLLLLPPYSRWLFFEWCLMVLLQILNETWTELLLRHS